MLDKAKTNPLFQSKLAQLPLFPIYYHASAFTPASAEHQKALVEGQANRGDEITGAIPGQEIPEEEA